MPSKINCAGLTSSKLVCHVHFLLEWQKRNSVTKIFRSLEAAVIGSKMIPLHINERKLPWYFFRSTFDCASSVLISKIGVLTSDRIKIISLAFNDRFVSIYLHPLISHLSRFSPFCDVARAIMNGVFFHNGAYDEYSSSSAYWKTHPDLSMDTDLEASSVQHICSHCGANGEVNLFDFQSKVVHRVFSC